MNILSLAFVRNAIHSSKSIVSLLTQTKKGNRDIFIVFCFWADVEDFKFMSFNVMINGGIKTNFGSIKITTFHTARYMHSIIGISQLIYMFDYVVIFGC